MWSEAKIWGAVPAGFKKITGGRCFRLVVREDRANEIDLSILDASRPRQASGHQGRNPLTAFRLRDGETALIRNYRHGGLFGSVRGSWYMSWPPRPFRELTITEELRRRGLSTVEVYAAAVERLYGPFYRGCLVTRELAGARDLWSALQDSAMDEAGRSAVLRSAAETILAMHRQGVYHADLNLKNLLVRWDHGRAETWVIDFDAAKLFLGNLPAPLVRNNLNRLLRSVRKLDPQRRYVTAAAWNQFLDFYYDGAG